MTIENFRLPVGRIVGGNIAIMQEVTDYHTKQKRMTSDGQVMTENRVDIAYPKQEFLEKVWPYIIQEVAAAYPTLANTNPDNCDQTRFAWKIINGDSPACPQGSELPYNARDGYKGCYILKIRTCAFLPPIFKFENGAYRKVEANEIKCGDFVVANVNVTVHNLNDGGIYWNPNAYELVGYGKEIVFNTAADPTKLFGNQTYNLPAGASMTPTSSAPANAQMPMPQAMPQAQPMPMAQPQSMPQPAYDFVQNAGVNCATGFTQPAAPATAQQQSAPQMANGTAQYATTFPTR